MVLNPKYSNVSEESDESNDDDARWIIFDDSEEYIANENNEGFLVIEVDQLDEGNRVEINGKKYRYKLKGNKSGSTIRSPSNIMLVSHPYIIVGSSRMGEKPKNQGV